METTGMHYGVVLQGVQDGRLAARQGWNGKRMFIFMRPADELHIDMVIDKVKSLPQSVKDFFLQDVTDEHGTRLPANENDKVKFSAYLCLKAADGSIVNGWLPSQTDQLATDWYFID